MRGLIALPLALLVAFPAAAHAADWRDGGLITEPDRVAQPMRAGIEGDGDALLAWGGYVYDGARPTIRHRPFGGELGPAGVLSPDDEALREAHGAGSDEVLLLSTAPLGQPRRVIVRSVRNGQPGDAQVLADTGAATGVCDARAALGPGGAAIVLYATAPPSPASPTSPDRERCSLRARSRRAAGAPFGPEVQLSGPAEISSVSAEFDAEGRALASWVERTEGQPDLRAVRYGPSEGFGPPQDVRVPGESVRTTTDALLRVAANGRAVLAFPSAPTRWPSYSDHVGAATGDTRSGFASGHILSGPAILAAGYGRDLDADAGDDGTIAVAWRAGRDSSAKVQGAIARPEGDLTHHQTKTMSRTQSRGARVAAGAGRATFAWFRRVPDVGRAIESRTGSPERVYTRFQRISGGGVAVVPPTVALSSQGAAWVAWGQRPIRSRSRFAVLKARKLTVATGRFSRVLDILRARTDFRSERLTPLFNLYATRNGAMLATVERRRQRPGTAGDRPQDFRRFFQLRTYGE